MSRKESEAGDVPTLTRLSRASRAWHLNGLVRKVEVLWPFIDPRVSCGHDLGGVRAGGGGDIKSE